jgi:hypothetical protein
MRKDLQHLADIAGAEDLVDNGELVGSSGGKYGANTHSCVHLRRSSLHDAQGGEVPLPLPAIASY